MAIGWTRLVATPSPTHPPNAHLLRASPPILKNRWLELTLWEAACKSATPILQNGWYVGRAGLEVEVGLQIGVILQVRAPPPKQKKKPPKQQRTNSIFLSDFQAANEIHLAFVFSLFYHLVYKPWVGNPACKPIDLNLLWGWSTLHFVAFCRMGGDGLKDLLRQGKRAL
jgi:hypothetical protein